VGFFEGRRDGFFVGFFVGRIDGFLDGRLLLRIVGLFVGFCFEGFRVGRFGVGFVDGRLEGLLLGEFVGAPLIFAEQKRPSLTVPVDVSRYRMLTLF
jgi:hypothetical protein